MSQNLTDYLARWRAVSEYELSEQRSAAIEDKLDALNALMLSVDDCGFRESLESDDQLVWDRWQRLRRLLGR